MGDGPYTDRFGYPLTATAAARRLASPRSGGFYHNGRWIRRKPKPPGQPPKPANDNTGPPSDTTK